MMNICENICEDGPTGPRAACAVDPAGCRSTQGSATMEWESRTVTPADDEPTPLLLDVDDGEGRSSLKQVLCEVCRAAKHQPVHPKTYKQGVSTLTMIGRWFGGLATPTTQEESSLQVAWTLTKLAVPLFMSSFSLAALRTTDSAVLGHTSTYALAVFSVADIWMKSSDVFLSGRVLSVLCSQAVGAGNKQLLGTSVTPTARPASSPTRTVPTRTRAGLTQWSRSTRY
jgi:hypothetical protein